jgi:PAS domain S-box-containing protein
VEPVSNRNEIESLLALISMQFVNAVPDAIDDAMQQALQIMGEALLVERGYVFVVSPDGTRMDNVREWCAAGIEPQASRRQGLSTRAFSWTMERLRNRDVVCFSRAEDIPVEARQEREEFQRAGVRSLLNVPLVRAGAVIGLMGFESVRIEHPWSTEEIRCLRILGSLFAGSLTRKWNIGSLRMSEERFRLAFEEGPVAMSLVSPEGRYVHVNEAYCKLLGYRPEEVIGRPMGIFTHPQDFQTYWAPTQQMLRGELPKLIGEARYRHKDGRFIWVRVTGAALHDRSGRVRYALGTMEDITDRKQAEDLLRAQRDLAESLSAVSDLTRALELCLETAVSISGMDCGGIYLVNDDDSVDLVIHKGLSSAFVEAVSHFEPRTPEVEVVRAGRPLFSPGDAMVLDQAHVRQEEKLKAAAILPVVHEGQTIACLNVASHVLDTVPFSSRHALEAVAAQIATALLRLKAEQALRDSEAELRSLFEHLRREEQLLRQMLDLHERDRKLIAYEIHDGLAQELTGALFNFQAASQMHDKDANQSQGMLQTGLRLLSSGIAEARRLISGLRPPILDESGVTVAIEYLVADSRLTSGREIEFVNRTHFGRLASPLENAIFRIVQEGLNNACRHSNSPRMRVVLSQQDDRVEIEIQDWGIGFDPQKVEETRFGLKGIRERTRLLGGQATIESQPGQGTRIRVELPLVESTGDDSSHIL